MARLRSEALESAAVHRKDILRLRLAVEDVLEQWKLGGMAEAVCTFRCGTVSW